jgi:hypothetical protein
MRSRGPSAAGHRKGREAVTERKTGYINGRHVPEEVLIRILAAEVRCNRSAIRGGMSAVGRAQSVTAVVRSKGSCSPAQPSKGTGRKNQSDWQQKWTS